MLNLLIKEYLAVCEYLLEVVTRNRESKDTLPMVRKGSLLVEKEALIDLLNKKKI